MPVPFHYNKLESIGDQLTVGCKVKEIAKQEKYSIDTIYQVRRRLLLTSKATLIIPYLKTSSARMITLEIKEVSNP